MPMDMKQSLIEYRFESGPKRGRRYLGIVPRYVSAGTTLRIEGQEAIVMMSRPPVEMDKVMYRDVEEDPRA